MTLKLLPLLCAGTLVGCLGSGRAGAEELTRAEQEEISQLASIEARLNQKLSLEFDNEKLETVLGLIGAISKINIVLDPKVRTAEPTVTLKVDKMDTATVLKWVTQLTDTHVEYVDKAFYVTKEVPKKKAEEERNALAVELITVGADTSILPPPGDEITDVDIHKVAQAIWEKTEPKPQDFPGPHVDLTPPPAGGVINPFAAPGGN